MTDKIEQIKKIVKDNFGDLDFEYNSKSPAVFKASLKRVAQQIDALYHPKEKQDVYKERECQLMDSCTACNGEQQFICEHGLIPEQKQSVCQCGHSVSEHFEGGGDVTYCEHKNCDCRGFALYSQEPQQVVCPKTKECGEECFYPDHQIPHSDNWGCTKPHNSKACPACIPVQPETPDELLNRDGIIWWTCPVDKTLRNFKSCFDGCEFYKSCELDSLKAQLAKCHQSEAARITELETDVKEWKSIANARDKMVDVACAEARADQNKKIGEYIEHWYDEWDDISSWNVMRRFVSQLELGKFSPEEAVK